MRIQVYFQGKILLDYINNQKDHNKIPKTFEILSTKIGCPKCHSDSMVDRIGYTPSVDSFCCYLDCHHSIEVKSILAEGLHKEAFTHIPFIIKAGSVNTYKSVNKLNKTLLLFWYNVVEKEKDYVKIEIRNCLTFEMVKLLEGINCSSEIVLQRKKNKFKPRLNLKIFPESCRFECLNFTDFKYNVSVGTKRQKKVISDSIIKKKILEFKKQKKIIVLSSKKI